MCESFSGPPSSPNTSVWDDQPSSFSHSRKCLAFLRCFTISWDGRGACHAARKQWGSCSVLFHERHRDMSLNGKARAQSLCVLCCCFSWEKKRWWLCVLYTLTISSKNNKKLKIGCLWGQMLDGQGWMGDLTHTLWYLLNFVSCEGITCSKQEVNVKKKIL